MSHRKGRSRKVKRPFWVMVGPRVRWQIAPRRCDATGISSASGAVRLVALRPGPQDGRLRVLQGSETRTTSPVSIDAGARPLSRVVRARRSRCVCEAAPAGERRGRALAAPRAGGAERARSVAQRRRHGDRHGWRGGVLRLERLRPRRAVLRADVGERSAYARDVRVVEGATPVHVRLQGAVHFRRVVQDTPHTVPKRGVRDRGGEEREALRVRSARVPEGRSLVLRGWCDAELREGVRSGRRGELHPRLGLRGGRVLRHRPARRLVLHAPQRRHDEGRVRGRARL